MKPADLPRTAYRSHDGITIYSRPGGTLTAEEQEHRFQWIRHLSKIQRDPIESLPRGRGPDDELDARAEGVMRGVFSRDTAMGLRLYLAWVYFRMVRRPGSPAAEHIEKARADLRLELERAAAAGNGSRV
jgi:hypothetical protein